MKKKVSKVSYISKVRKEQKNFNTQLLSCIRKDVDIEAVFKLLGADKAVFK